MNFWVRCTNTGSCSQLQSARVHLCKTAVCVFWSILIRSIEICQTTLLVCYLVPIRRYLSLCIAVVQLAHPNMLTSDLKKLKTNVRHCVCILANKAVFAHTVKTHTGWDILYEWCWILTAPLLLAKWGFITAYSALILSCSAAALRLEIMCSELRVKVSISCVSICAFRMFLAFIGWSSIEYTVVGRQWGGLAHWNNLPQ